LVEREFAGRSIDQRLGGERCKAFGEPDVFLAEEPPSRMGAQQHRRRVAAPQWRVQCGHHAFPGLLGLGLPLADRAYVEGCRWHAVEYPPEQLARSPVRAVESVCRCGDRLQAPVGPYGQHAGLLEVQHTAHDLEQPVEHLHTVTGLDQDLQAAQQALRLQSQAFLALPRACEVDQCLTQRFVVVHG
jgi:hypothetical protein